MVGVRHYSGGAFGLREYSAALFSSRFGTDVRRTAFSAALFSSRFGTDARGAVPPLFFDVLLDTPDTQRLLAVGTRESADSELAGAGVALGERADSAADRSGLHAGIDGEHLIHVHLQERVLGTAAASGTAGNRNAGLNFKRHVVLREGLKNGIDAVIGSVLEQHIRVNCRGLFRALTEPF